jgi:hypothetical protein
MQAETVRYGWAEQLALDVLNPPSTFALGIPNPEERTSMVLYAAACCKANTLLALSRRGCFEIRDFKFTVLDLLLDVLRVLTIYCATDRNASAKHFTHGTGHSLAHGTPPHDLTRINNASEGKVTIMLDVLNLLAVTLGLLKSLDEKRGGRGDKGDLGERIG